MPENPKETIENFVASALKARLDEGTRAIGETRDALLEALGGLEEKLRSAGGKAISLPDDLFPAPAPAPATGLVSHVRTSQEEMLAATDQIGLLTQLLLSCTVSCPRVAFFIVRKDAIVGWAARGFDGAQDSDIRNLTIGMDERTILGAACKSLGTARGSGGEYAQDRMFLSKLGGETPAESMAIPIFIRDKIVAVLYGDSGRDEAISDPEIPEVLATHAGLCLETLATRLKYPRPKAGAAPRPPQPSRPAGPPAPESASLSGVFQQPDLSSPGPGPVEKPDLSASGPRPSVQSDLSASGARPAATAKPAAPAVTAAPDLSGLSEPERKLHEEARRFARLLVSEIVLYNEKQAEEGRRNKDIYERLKDDIDRSLQMYEQRVSAKVRSTSNYFYDELVRTLANGDESAIKVPWA